MLSFHRSTVIKLGLKNHSDATLCQGATQEGNEVKEGREQKMLLGRPDPGEQPAALGHACSLPSFLFSLSSLCLVLSLFLSLPFSFSLPFYFSVPFSFSLSSFFSPFLSSSLSLFLSPTFCLHPPLFQERLRRSEHWHSAL